MQRNIIRNYLKNSCSAFSILRNFSASGDIPNGFIPPYEERKNEPLEQKRARLLYQSRKRGMLENDLLLSTFAAKYLHQMSEKQLVQYDRLINLPTNDWDIYYWATGVVPTPDEFDNEIMDALKEHIKNKERVMRIKQPDLTLKQAGQTKGSSSGRPKPGQGCRAIDDDNENPIIGFRLNI